MPPQILFALQSPTLLNNLAQIRDVWDLRWVQVENVDFQEKELIDVPEWDGEVPVAFVGCAPDHERWAHDNIRGVPYVHFAHTFNPALLGDSSGKDCVALHGRGVKSLMAHRCPRSVTVLSPHYEANPVWSWAPNIPWTEMSRPKTRLRHYSDRAKMMERSGPFYLYGQDQPLGFLSGEPKMNRLKSSSCYVAMFGEDAGFSLAAHEVMAAGVPLVARIWGDMAEDAPGHQGLASSDEHLVRLARRCCSDRGFAEEVSAAGLDYIRRCRTLDRLRGSATELLRKISSTS